MSFELRATDMHMGVVDDKKNIEKHKTDPLRLNMGHVKETICFAELEVRCTPQ